MSSKSNLLNELFKDLATGPRQLAGGPKPPAAPLSKDPKGVSNVDSNGASNQVNNTNNQQRMRTGSVASSSTATTPPPMSVNRVDSDVSSSAVLAAPTMPSRSHSGTALQVFAKASSYVAKTSAAKALKATTITLVKADPSQVSMGARVASSGKFITYANKAGMVRVIHTESVHTGLLRGHAEPIADMKFCPNQDSLVATVSSDGFAIVWELRHMPETGKVEFREAIRLHTSRPEEPFHGVEWHATNQRVFSLMHGNTISVVMLSSKLWSAQQAAGQEGIPIENARCAYAQFAGNSPGGRVLSASFSADGNTLLAGCADGTVAGLNASSLMEDADSTPLSTLWQLSAGDGLGVSLCRFLNRGDHFLLTAVRGNTLLRLWTWDSGSVKYKPSHELKLADGGPLYSAAVDSTGQYVFVGIPQRNVLLCSKLDTTAVQLEQPVEYELDCPVLSFATRRSAPETEEILCQQTNGIQFFSFSPAADYEQVRRQSPSPVIASPVPTMPGGRSTRERQDSGLMTPDQLQHQQQQQQQQQQQPKAQQQQQQQQQPQQPQQVQQAPQVQQPQHQPQPVMYSQQAMPMHHMQQANGMMYGAGIGNLDEALARHLSALEARQKEVADAQAQTSLAQQKGLLEVLAKSLGEIPENIDDAVKEAFEDEEAAAALADALLVKITPALGSALTEAMDTQSASKFNAVDAVAAKVAQALRKPAQEAFSEAMRVSFIPAFEAGCNNLLTQFQQAAQQLQAATSSNESALAQQLQQVRERQSSMESTLQRIEAMLSASNGRMQQQQQSPSPPHQQQHQQPMQHTPPPQHTPSPNLPYQQHQQHQQHQQGAVRNSATSKPIFGDIMSHVSNGNYEGAFLMALSESDLDLVVATCSLVDPERVFGGDRGRVALSQRVLLALVQQLSVDLTVETPLKLQWMQRGALALDPSDPDVGIHVARVMSDVRSHMEQQRPYIVQPEGTGASPNRSLFEMCLNIVSSRASTQAF